METVTITLNGREVSGQQGMTILDLAKESGLVIPTLCHDPNLASYGACRICIVEDERSGALMASCVTPIAPGMVINTQSPRVLERRAILVELMLASHPDSCLVCDKGNRCQLRNIASGLGVGLVRLQRIPQFASIEEVNPFIERDLSKCILCAKCIRACEDLVCEGALDYLGRGFASKPATLGDQPLEKSECTFCGTCVAMCPTGAIMEKEKSYRGTSATRVRTVCPACSCGCGISFDVNGERLVRAVPDEDSPINKGTLCIRGSYGYDFVHSPERLTTPLVKVNGNFEVVSWEEALRLVADGFKRIKETGGPGSLAVFGSSKCTNEDNYLLQRFARCVLGTNNIDNGSRLDGFTSFVGSTKPIGDIEESQVILVIGTDPASSAPLVGYAIRRAVRQKGARLLVVGPCQTVLNSWAHLRLQPRAGTDVALVNGMVKTIIEEKLFDKDSVIKRVDNFEALAKALQDFTAENTEDVTGVSWGDIVQAAKIFAGARKASIVYDNGIGQQGNVMAALTNLALLTDMGDGARCLYMLRRDSNGQGACDMGSLPDCLPGYQSLTDAMIREKFEARWGCRLPTEAGLAAFEMVKAAEAGSIRGMYIVGENPAVSFPNSDVVRQALESLDFLVVQDMFLTKTAKLAKVVLPAASFVEKEGTFTNFEGRVQRLRKAFNPLGDSLPDWEIVLRLANKMDYPMAYLAPKEVMDEIAELVPLYSGVSYTRLDVKGPRDVRVNYRQSEHKQFLLLEQVPQPIESGDVFPFTLLVGNVLYQFGTGTRSSRSARLKKFVPEAFVEINPADARKLKVKDGNKVRVSSLVGQVTVAARITESVGKGSLFMPASWPESPVFGLFDFVTDNQTRTLAVKSCSVKLERVSADG
ncbi:MAG: formate dehydrogenase subunit alpha [Chloroflexi bacterium]|nr:formate dehydrogenase subunit alpha [Chloroflexota bacterium]MBM3165836.1 formate dehydrogenase subunit alpha [Chloroflexota bacterium]MBM4449302.1 formate dehydrogenase subunit alpha [Chloroflexota bacterium]